MKQTFTVNGMMCMHCAARVENAIKAIAGVTDAKVNLDAKQVEVEGEVAADDVKKAVEGAGYEFVGA